MGLRAQQELGKTSLAEVVRLMDGQLVQRADFLTRVHICWAQAAAMAVQ
jgi:hypothetical protein